MIIEIITCQKKNINYVCTYLLFLKTQFVILICFELCFNNSENILFILIKTNLFLNFNQQFFILFLPLFFTKFEFYNRIIYYVFEYFRIVPDDFETNKRLNLIYVSLISDVLCTINKYYIKKMTCPHVLSPSFK